MSEATGLHYKGFGVRHLQCFLIFFGITLSHALRVNLSVAIVAMTDKSADAEFGVFMWNERIKSLILSSFFWGYVITQVPGGVIAQKYGGHRIFLIGVFMCSALAVLTPFCAQFGGWQFVCGLRLLQGLFQGIVMPATHSLLSKWVPAHERGKLGTFCYSGSHFGIALMYTLSGEIASSFLGWPGIFYLSGSVGCVWAVFFYFFATSSPDESRLISVQEKQFIKGVPDSSEPPKTTENDEPKPKLPTPWKDILTSVPFYCILVSHCSDSFLYCILLTQIPTYFKSILEMDIKKNAVFSSLPYWVTLVLSFLLVSVSEVLRRKKLMSLSTSRKFFNSMGQLIPVLGLVGLGYLGKAHEGFVIGLLCLIVGLKGACYLGYKMNHIDLSPNFASTLMGMTNCMAQFCSSLAPLIVGFVVSNEKNLEQWRTVFFMTAGFLFTGNFLFVSFGKFETQYWNEPPVKNSDAPTQNVGENVDVISKTK